MRESVDVEDIQKYISEMMHSLLYFVESVLFKINFIMSYGGSENLFDAVLMLLLRCLISI